MRHTEYDQDTVPIYPMHPYREDAVRLILSLADSYLRNADKLIYSGGGRTFLSGFDIYDKDNGNRGNIDCSTYILLVMAGIPFEKSPYMTGNVYGLSSSVASWADPALADFRNLPDSYRGVAEVIGRPDLVGDDGVDLEKAKASGIDWTAVHAEMARNGMIRRAHQIARYYWEQGECFSDSLSAMPGDLVFYRAGPKWEEGFRFFGVFHEIAHVGIISANRDLIYNSTGNIRKSKTMEEARPAVSLDAICGSRKPAFYARPAYENGSADN